MKKLVLLVVTFLSFISIVSAQTTLKQYKAGHTFSISLPDYMSKTIGLNSDATIQYKSKIKDVYGFVIVDSKEDLALAEMNFSSLKEFYENFIAKFLKDEEKRVVSAPVYKKVGDINFVETDVTYYDKEAEAEIYYLAGVVETKAAFYKVMSWATKENKDTFKADFQKILYSLKD
ncbi:hypothetical protein LJ707_05560 [Mucilaginibacter sp. UR6-1]|uniref:hypothetical protein n=1 Tax=Mucilaginibacter sp. UR6-1 TaxID=1435643 RepID=UPI001E2CDED2|nr:hypothetical protein [Mucilaginibacter sp. UR6-1]MCC8408387.1 hypothetical protein [Mucilaginibacter sp. UR6-1]